MPQATVNGLEIVAFIGLDWSDKQHCICLQASDSSAVEFDELLQTAEALHQWVAKLRCRFGGRKVALALEQSKGAVIYALMQYDFLVLFPINPKALAKYREAFAVSGAKDDPTDAELLADFVRSHHDKLRAWMPDDEKTRALGMLSEQRRKLVDDRTALINRLTSTLKQYFPQAIEWIGPLDSRQAWEFLSRWPTLQSLRKASATQLHRFFDSYRRRNKAQFIQQLVEQISQAVALTDDFAVVTTNSLVVQATVAQLPCLDAAIACFDQQLAALFEQHPDREIFQSLPGAGPALEPRLLAAFGSRRDRFQQAQEIEQLSGVAPVTKRSGKSLYVHRRFACSKFLRQTFHEYAEQSISKSAWARVYYQLQRSRGKGHHAAVRALAFKWIRIIFRCWKDRTLYNEEQYLQALRRRNSPLVPLLQEATI